MTYTITTKVVNARTGEQVINGSFEMNVADYDFKVMDANAQAFKEMMPDCQVTMSCSNGDFASLMALNMQKDEDTLSWEEYSAKWCSGYISREEYDAERGWDVPTTQEWRWAEMSFEDTWND